MSGSQGTGAANPIVDRDRTPPADRKPSWRKLSAEEKYSRPWTIADLTAALLEDHTWLSSDPVQAEKWKNKLLQSETPIRSFAMFKKWNCWKLEGKRVRRAPAKIRRRRAKALGVAPARYSLRSRLA